MSSLSALVILAGLLASSPADKPDLEMQVYALAAPPPSGQGHAHRLTCVTVYMRNSGRPIQAGLEVRLDSDRGSLLHAQDVDVPGQSTRRYQVYASAGLMGKKVVALLRGRREVLQSNWCTAPRHPDFIMLDRGTRARPMFVRDQATVEAIVPPLWALPDVHWGYNAGQAVVVGDVNPNDLSLSQRQALVGYVHHGGTLVLCGGVAGPGLLSTFLSDLLPGATCELVQVQTLHSLAAHCQAGLSLRQPIVAAALSGPGVRPEVLEAGVPIIASRRALGGRVVWLGVDVGRGPLRDWAGTRALWTQLANTGRAQREFMPSRMMGWREMRPDPTPFTGILGFFMLYLICLGPLVFVVLRRLKAPMAVWLIAPCLAAGFCAATMVIRSSLEHAASNLWALSVMECFPGEAQACLRVQATAFSRGRAEHRMTIPRVHGVAALAGGSDRASRVVKRSKLSAGGLVFDPLRLPLWGSEKVLVEATVEHTPLAEGRVVSVGPNQWTLKLTTPLPGGLPQGMILLPQPVAGDPPRGAITPAVEPGKPMQLWFDTSRPLTANRPLRRVWDRSLQPLPGYAAYIVNGDMYGPEHVAAAGLATRAMPPQWAALPWVEIERDPLMHLKFSRRTLVAWLPIVFPNDATGTITPALVQCRRYWLERAGDGEKEGRRMNRFLLPEGIEPRITGLSVRLRWDHVPKGYQVEILDWEQNQWDRVQLKLPAPPQTKSRGRRRRSTVNTCVVGLSRPRRYIAQPEGVVLARERGQWGSRKWKPYGTRVGQRIEIEARYGPAPAPTAPAGE